MYYLKNRIVLYLNITGGIVVDLPATKKGFARSAGISVYRILPLSYH